MAIWFLGINPDLNGTGTPIDYSDWYTLVVDAQITVSPGLTLSGASAGIPATGQAGRPGTGIDANLNGAIPFNANSQWNTQVVNAPVLWDSAQIMASIGANVGLHPDFGSGTYNGITIGIPYVVVPADQPLVAFIDNLYTSESDPGPFPIPADAPVEGAGAAAYNDNHLVVVQLDANGNLAKEYDFFQVSQTANGTWQGYSVAFNLTGGDDQLPMGNTSATASGLPILPGLITYDQVQAAIAQGGTAGHLDHALAFTLNSWDIGSALFGAAEHSTGGTGPADFGMVFRLKADYVIDPTMSLVDQVILNTLKIYGMILIDNGSNFFLSGVPDARWDNADLHRLQTEVSGTDFQIVDTTGLTPPPAVSVGSGSDSLVLTVSENPYHGNAQFTVSIDGQQQGGIQTIDALNSGNETQTFTYLGNWGTTQETISINFIDPLTDASGSRAMLLQTVSYDGAATAASAAALTATGATTFKIGVVPTVGSGADTLVLHLSETAHKGDAQFTVSVDGVQIGGVLTCTMPISGGQTEDFDILGNWGSGLNGVTVNFINGISDAGGSMNLFVNGMSYDGVSYAGNQQNLYGGGTGSFLIGSAAPIGSGADTLVLHVFDTAYLGDAQFTVDVDGVQVGGVETALLLASGGQTQDFTFLGNWGAGQQTVTVNFVNGYSDAGGSRNLYVEGMSYDGSNYGGNTQNLYGGGVGSFLVGTASPIGSGSDTLVVNLCEAAYLGDAQFTVSVDGVRVGGVETATLLASSGKTEAFTFLGNWTGGQHTVTVNFLNGISNAGGSMNLFVEGMSYDGITYAGNAANLYGGGSASFKVAGSNTVGSGSDTLVLHVCETAYQGNAQFTVSINGVQIGGVLTATTQASSGQTQNFSVLGNWGSGQQSVTVNFLNGVSNAGGSMNLFLWGMSYDGTNYGNNVQNLYGGGVGSFLVGTASPIGSGPDTLVVNLCEAAYQGDAQFTVSVDGVQIGGVETATLLSSSGKLEAFTFQGNWGSGLNAVTVNFVNGLSNAGGSRNLYIEGMNYNGTNVANYQNLYGGGTGAFTVGTAAPVGSGSDTLVLHVFDTAYKGDAQFTVSVNGVQIGGVQTALLLASGGQTQNFTFLGNWGSAQQAVTVNFINGYTDAGGSRNLFVEGMSYDGTNYGGNTQNLYGGGVGTFLVGTASPIGTGPDALVVKVFETAYQGDAQFTLSVNGVQIGGVETATLLASNGKLQSFTFDGNWGSGLNTVSVNFVNGLSNAGGSRNLFVEGMTYDGTGYGNNAANLYGGGSASFTVGSNTIAVSSASLAASSQLTFVSPSAQTLTGSPGFGNEFQAASANLNGETISYFGGNDVIDLTDMGFAGASGTYIGSATGGTLTISNGTHTAAIGLIGGSTYSHSTFSLVSDGHNGTAVLFV